MPLYKNLAGDSGVLEYESGLGSIVVKFRKGGTYVYDENRPGSAHVAEMQRLAESGKGLCTYINTHVRKNYASKLT
jgi:hypothetical protein